MHGEQFRSEIAELAEIRLNLMREKNPSLTESRVNQLADQQWDVTSSYDNALGEELQGIVDGSKLSRAQITVLNNYTDFRDIQLADDQGCSVVYVNYQQTPVAGQTWDMHSSAKRYVSVIKINDEQGLESLVFSLVGCIGMMGFTRLGTTVQVNNINTDGAVAGAMWPAVVRKTLQFPEHKKMSNHLSTAPVTSGHNYLLASRERAEMWEVMPGLAECVDAKTGDEEGSLFHTNHCLGHNSTQRETTISQNSTTHVRFDLIKKKIPNVRTYADMYGLLNDHENYPKSICSNFQSNAQDPSVTCGGAIGNLKTGQVEMWRGDEVHDENFVKHAFQF
jgi:isopenicillin-N N-acyltransferase-like protein